MKIVKEVFLFNNIYLSYHDSVLSWNFSGR